MKLVFAGPTLPPDLRQSCGSRLRIRPPAGFGDIARAVLQGATVIGLIDGVFEDCAATWHKEILYALSLGVQVLGAASMGALRAAECARYGMVGVGEIFEMYASGVLVDDDAVAQIHAPAEFGYLGLSEPLVNIEATCGRIAELGLISVGEAATLRAAARRLFFKERSLRATVDAATGLSGERRHQLGDLLERYRRDLKAEDSGRLLAAVDALPDRRQAPPRHWQFEPTRIWLRLLERERLKLATEG